MALCGHPWDPVARWSGPPIVVDDVYHSGGPG